MPESTHPADLSKSAPGIDTTQPAGALPEPVHFRALLADDQRPQQLNSAMHVCGFRDRRTAESWVASKLDFDRWRYTLEPLYAEGDMRALMAERDAAREELAKADACTAALRRERDFLQKTATRRSDRLEAAGLHSDCTQEEAAALRRELEAREGREPLTEEQQHALWQKTNGEWLTDEADFKAGIRAAEKHHGIGPAGTSADGETQHG